MPPSRDYFVQLAVRDDHGDAQRRLAVLIDFGTLRGVLAAAGLQVERLALLPSPAVDNDTLEQLWQRAREHGEESELDHEVGDLQELSRLCWELLTEKQRRLVVARLAPETVICQFCQEEVPASTAHLHGGELVGADCCWDERLRAGDE
jgi:formylmethanofuran dehydrogenase subunit E